MTDVVWKPAHIARVEAGVITIADGYPPVCDRQLIRVLEGIERFQAAFGREYPAKDSRDPEDHERGVAVVQTELSTAWAAVMRALDAGRTWGLL